MGVTAAVAAVAAAGVAGSVLGSSMGQKPTVPDPPPSSAQNDLTNENEAHKAAERRRRLYAGLGRSSTILTGPGGLGSAPAEGAGSAPKQLLGL